MSSRFIFLMEVFFILSASCTFGQPMRTTQVIALYSKPSLNAPAPTYPPANSLLIINEKANEVFYRVIYRDHGLYMHESSLQYCMPVDTAQPENQADAQGTLPSLSTDSAFKLKPLKPWYTRKYGVASLQDLSVGQYNNALSLANISLITGGTLLTAGLTSLGTGIYCFYEMTQTEGWDGVGYAIFGYVLSAAGLTMSAVSLPFLGFGAARKKQLRAAFSKPPAEISINPCLMRQLHQYGAGLTLTITL